MRYEISQNKQEYFNKLSASGFRRISSKIEALWHTDQCSDYFKSLLVDRSRGYRAGFPCHVYRVILKLYTIYCFEHNMVDEWAETFFEKV